MENFGNSGGGYPQTDALAIQLTVQYRIRQAANSRREPAGDTAVPENRSVRGISVMVSVGGILGADCVHDGVRSGMARRFVRSQQ